MRILVADDETVARHLIHASLVALGHDVIVAEDGAEALRRHRQGDIHMVVSDWLMPGMSGVDLCREIRTHEDWASPYTYFVLVTGRRDRASFFEGMSAGADDFLAKPFEPHELQVRVAAGERIVAVRDRLAQLETVVCTCSYCHCVRLDAEAWGSLEAYLERHSRTRFSHGICPDCYRRHVGTDPGEAPPPW